MQLVAVLILGLGAIGRTIASAEKVVFLVPRSIGRSYMTNTSPSTVHRHVEGTGHRVRRPSFVDGNKRASYSGDNFSFYPGFDRPFFTGEEHRDWHDSEHRPTLLDHRHPQELVDHVTIPHGEGISHGISYGKGYIPDNEFRGTVRGSRSSFPGASKNYLGYADAILPKLIGQELWNNNADNDNDGELTGIPVHSDRKAKGRDRFEFHDTRENFDQLEFPVAADDYLLYPRMPAAAKPRAVVAENDAGTREISHSSVAQIIVEGRKMTPIILRDTFDMREYIAKIETLARSWPFANDLAKLYRKNQLSDTWGATGGAEGYQVREEFPESETTGPARSYATIIR